MFPDTNINTNYLLFGYQCKIAGMILDEFGVTVHYAKLTKTLKLFRFSPFKTKL